MRAIRRCATMSSTDVPLSFRDSSARPSTPTCAQPVRWRSTATPTRSTRRARTTRSPGPGRRGGRRRLVERQLHRRHLRRRRQDENSARVRQHRPASTRPSPLAPPPRPGTIEGEVASAVAVARKLSVPRRRPGRPGAGLIACNIASSWRTATPCRAPPSPRSNPASSRSWTLIGGLHGLSVVLGPRSPRSRNSGSPHGRTCDRSSSGRGCVGGARGIRRHRRVRIALKGRWARKAPSCSCRAGACSRWWAWASRSSRFERAGPEKETITGGGCRRRAVHIRRGATALNEASARGDPARREPLEQPHRGAVPASSYDLSAPPRPG